MMNTNTWMMLYGAYALWEICRTRHLEKDLSATTEPTTTTKKTAKIIAPVIAGVGYQLGSELASSLRSNAGADGGDAESASMMDNLLTGATSIAQGALSVMPEMRTVVLGLGVLATACVVYKYWKTAGVNISNNANNTNTIHNVVHIHVEPRSGMIITHEKQPDGSSQVRCIPGDLAMG